MWVKFYKVDKARTREYGGSGIGLSIVEATMKAHGKDYGVANVEGGVEFTLMWNLRILNLYNVKKAFSLCCVWK